MDINQKPRNQIKTIISPLRYPGSKRSLVWYIKDALLLNNLKPKLLVEPFVGGGSVSLNFLEEEYVSSLILADIDPWITSFWKTLFFETEWLLGKIETLEVTIEKWHEFKHTKPTDEKGQALTCFFLNRTSFSGILEERAGPIGGKNQNSNYPIDCRFTPITRKTIIKRIEQISRYRNKIYGIWNLPWQETIKRIRLDQDENKLPSSDLFFYFDPPFFEKAENLYRFYFISEDHSELRDFLINLKDKWILSYDSANHVKELYGKAIERSTNGTKLSQIEIPYFVGKKSKGTIGQEAIISNLGLLPPQYIKT